MSINRWTWRPSHHNLLFMYSIVNSALQHRRTVAISAGVILFTASAVALLDTPLAAYSHQAKPQSYDTASLPVPPDMPSWRAGEVGLASWYGGEFHGRLAASGEVFDQNALTAAHPRLPFGAKVRVINVETGQSVVVRINDRGPFVDNRIIDISRRAASELGFLESGVEKVRVEVIALPE